MATIELFAAKINMMPSLIGEAKKAVLDYKTELEAIRTKALAIDTSAIDLSEVIASVKASTEIQDRKIESLDALNGRVEQFISDVVRIDQGVAELIRLRKNEFYDAHPSLKPEAEKTGWEKFCNGCASVGQWCREHWKEILFTVLIIVGAALAIMAVVCTGGMALVPLLATVLSSLGVSAGAAMTIATIASLTVAVIAVISTIGSSVMNIIDLWFDMSGNKTFQTWRTVLNWTSMISNGFYAVGSIYNAFKGITSASLREYGKRWLSDSNFRSVISGADNFNLTLQPSSSTFWAGLGEDGSVIARGFAEGTGRSTLETALQTNGYANPTTELGWQQASSSYAMNSSGSVDVLLGDSVGTVLPNGNTIGNVWLNYERVLLNINPNVTEITQIMTSGPNLQFVINIPRVFQVCSFDIGIDSLISGFIQVSDVSDR